MTSGRYSFTAQLWEHDGHGAWYFLTLPETVADDIDEVVGDGAKGFGSVRVEVTIGTTCWLTSVFPDTKRGTYVLPVKKAVRVAEHLTAGSTAVVDLVLVD